MRWPWSRKPSADRLIVSLAGQQLAYLQARSTDGGGYEITRAGVVLQGSDTLQAFQSRVQSLDLRGGELHMMLRPEQYQFLQIDVPAVPAEELRSAARYQIRDMVDAHLDDLTIDVMRLGDGQQKGASQLYVVAAKNAVVRELSDFAQALRWPLRVIDIQETAQRNLQSTVAPTDGRTGLASAALMVVSAQQALLTISAFGELFYSRRLDLPTGFLDMRWQEEATQVPVDAQGYTPVPAYEPDYSGATSFDYSAATPAPSGGRGVTSDTERAQRVLVEVQRSLDLWDRTWSALPLAGLRVFAGVRSRELAAWLSQEMGQPVDTLDLQAQHPVLGALSSMDLITCMPLLGVLLRSQSLAH